MPNACHTCNGSGLVEKWTFEYKLSKNYRISIAAKQPLNKCYQHEQVIDFTVVICPSCDGHGIRARSNSLIGSIKTKLDTYLKQL